MGSGATRLVRRGCWGARPTGEEAWSPGYAPDALPVWNLPLSGVVDVDRGGGKTRRTAHRPHGPGEVLPRFGDATHYYIG
jgi:hypothetical protein